MADANPGAQRGMFSGSARKPKTSPAGAAIETDRVSLRFRTIFVCICRSSIYTYDLSTRILERVDSEDDLGALFARITRRLIDAERPLLDERGLSMWEYIALSELGRRAAPSQLALARRIGYDKTRLIALLDGLTGRGLIERAPDPEDRRAHVIELTPKGTKLLDATRRDIRAMEKGLLAGLTKEQRTTLRATLARLAEPARPAASGD
jgi:DNA-binding MarR family transcriptional regulator